MGPMFKQTNKNNYTTITIMPNPIREVSKKSVKSCKLKKIGEAKLANFDKEMYARRQIIDPCLEI